MATGPTEIKPAARITSDNRWRPTNGAMVGKRERREWASFEAVADLVNDPSGSPVPGGTLYSSSTGMCPRMAVYNEGRGTRDGGSRKKTRSLIRL